jgi:hypothetical protein
MFSFYETDVLTALTTNVAVLSRDRVTVEGF